MDELKSKSQKKREADALQKLGVSLVALSAEKLARLSLPEKLLETILEAKSLKSHGAIRRQLQLIGKLMRNADSEAIIAAYQTILAEADAQTASFHEVESWRARLLLNEGAGLTDFIIAYPHVEKQKLRQLLKKAMEEQTLQVNHGASKALFRYLRTIIMQNP